jgi:hypothetical protein
VCADQLSYRVALFTIMGDFVQCVGSRETLDWPCDVCVSDMGEYVVVSPMANCVVVFSADGRTVATRFGCKGASNGRFMNPSAITVSQGRLFVVESQSGRVQVFE